MVILLTGCINPDGMILTSLNDKEIRMQQYVDAIKFYLSHTKYPIVFAENSGTDISDLFQAEIQGGILEIICFKGNQNKDKGKGYGEATIIEYALKHSLLLSATTEIVKITGRLIVENLSDVLNQPFPLEHHSNIICNFNTELTFPDSRVFVADKDFLWLIVNDKEQMNDSKGVFFEHILAHHALRKDLTYAPFWTEPSVKGISGSTGQHYDSITFTPSRKIYYHLHALQCYQLYMEKSGKQSIVKETLCKILSLKYKLVLFCKKCKIF